MSTLQLRQIKAACGYLAVDGMTNKEAVFSEVRELLRSAQSHRELAQSVIEAKSRELMDIIEMSIGSHVWCSFDLGSTAQVAHLARLLENETSMTLAEHAYRSILANRYRTLSTGRVHVARAAAEIGSKLLLRLVLTDPGTDPETRLHILTNEDIVLSETFRRQAKFASEIYQDLALTDGVAEQVSKVLFEKSSGRCFTIFAKLGLARHVNSNANKFRPLMTRINTALASNHGRLLLHEKLPPLQAIIRAPVKALDRRVLKALDS